MHKNHFPAIFLALLLTGCSKPTETAERSFFAMDTYVTITASGENAAQAVILAEERIKELESQRSVTDENSEIYRLNHSGGSPVEVSAETAELIRFSKEMSELTDGAFDITLYPILTEWGFTEGEYHIPEDDVIAALLADTGSEKINIDGRIVTIPENMMTDLGGIAKGDSGDEAARIIKENGIGSALLDLGGNVHAIGSKPDGSPWRIGIQDPFGEGTIGVLEVSDRAVITSGGYERYFVGEDGKTYIHILDPENGRPARSGLASVTVIGTQGRFCDAMSTALFVMGAEKAEALWRSRDDFEMLLITEDDKLILTEGLEDIFTPDNAHSAETEILRR